MNVRAWVSVSTPEFQGTSGGGINPTLSQGDIEYMDLNFDHVAEELAGTGGIEIPRYRMSVLFRGKQSDGFAVKLTILDDSCAALDSTSIIASLERFSEFEFSPDDVKFHGKVFVEAVIAPIVKLD